MNKLDLKELRKKKSKPIANGSLDISIPGLDSLHDVKNSIDELVKTITGQDKYDFDEIKNQLALIDRHLNLSPELEKLTKALREYSKTKNVNATIIDFAKLLDAVKANKPVKIDLSELQKTIVEIRDTITNKTDPIDQAPKSYTPMRRVIKVGARFMFDDNITNPGGGGGGTSIDISTLAKESKQPLNPGVDYDYLDVQQTDSDTETYVYKTGGSGGTTVRTIVVNYTDSTKENIDNVAWS